VVQGQVGACRGVGASLSVVAECRPPFSPRAARPPGQGSSILGAELAL
jgi:hypothetical protein